MKKNQLIIFLAVAIVSLCLASCGDDDDQGSAETTFSSYGALEGRSGSIVGGKQWQTYSPSAISPSWIKVFTFDYGGSGKYEYYTLTSASSGYYSYEVDNEYPNPPAYGGSHHLYENSETKYFTYGYDANKNLYKIAYSDGNVEYYRVNIDNGDVRQTDETGNIVYVDYSSNDTYYMLYPYALNLYYYNYYSGSSGSGSSGGSGSGSSSSGGSSSGGSGSSSSGSGSSSSSSDYQSVTAVKIIEVKGLGYNSNSYSRSSVSLYKQKSATGRVVLYTRGKSMIGVASTNYDSRCGSSTYSVSTYSYKVVEYGVTSNTYYYFN